jgi:hypothetical protein
MPTNLASLSLYRHAIRTVYHFPVTALQPKLKYNIRHAFELYRNASPEQVLTLQEDGKFDIDTLDALGNIPNQELMKLFRSQDISLLLKKGRKGGSI